MNSIFKPDFRTGFLFLFILISNYSVAQVLINEICPSNISNIVNENGQHDDWIEIFNDGSSPVNMGGYGLSDEIAKPYKFTFPFFELGPGQRAIVFASGINRTDLSNHWETAVLAQTTWKYFVGNSEPDTNWRNLNFNQSSWSSGQGGIGLGDGDDNTVISQCKSVMMRKEFFVPDTANINSAIFNIDYDDGFVAFLNGVEIARANLGVPGDRPRHDDYATHSHEAMMYQGHQPDSFYIDAEFLKTFLLPGVNVLAVQVHNSTSSSGDLSAIPFLSFGMLSSTQTFSNVPAWFRTPDFQYFQADFKLSRDGETILLTDDTGFNLDQQQYPRMDPGHSTGRSSDGSSSWCIFTSPTPLSSNASSTCYPGYASDPVFSLAEGFYSSSRSLSLSTSQSGAKIRYTTDGSEPSSSSSQYSSSININSTKTIRVKVYKSGYLPSPTFTKSYFINEDIDLPVVTVSLDPDDLWDYHTGIYATGPGADSAYPYKGANFWQDWEREASIEYYDVNKDRQLSFDAHIEIFGNYSQAKPQKSFEIKLSAELGTSEIEYPLFPDKPQITETDNFVLRNSGTDWNKVHYRDALMERVMKNTHSGYLATDPVVVFLNGDYWGVYTVHENHDQHWIKNNFGYKKDEIDFLLEGGNIETKFGSDDSFWDLINYATNQNPNGSQYYENIDEMLDINNFVDYMIAETYFNNGDWMGDWTNNIKMWRPQASGGKWKYLLYDLDFGLGMSGSVNDNRLAIARNPASQNYTSDLFDALLGNTQFKTYFINRYADLINTIFKSSNLKDVSEEFEDNMRHDMSDHFSKWSSFNGENFSISTWNSKISSMESFINSRPGKVRDHIQTEFSLQSQVSLTFNASPSGSGRIQISTVNPESYPWTGVYFRGNPVTITAMPNPGYEFDHWRSNVAISSNNPNQVLTVNFTSTDQITAYFSGSSESPKLTISEINYHSASTQEAGDWIELHNYGSVDLDISNWKLRDKKDYHTYTFPVGTVIESGEYLVVSEDLQKFQTYYPQVNNVIGPIGFSFDNGDDEVRIFDYTETKILEADYEDDSPWPMSADGQGYTLELDDPLGNLSDASNWFSGCLGGSPGRAYSAPSTNVSASGPTDFCIGGQVELSSNNGSGNTYQWYNNGNIIFGATQSNYTATTSGNYSVNITDQGCSVFSTSISVNAIPQGLPPVAGGAYTCGPGAVTLHAHANDTVFWYEATSGNLIGYGENITTPALTTTTTFLAQTSSVCPSSAVTVVAEIRDVSISPITYDNFTCGTGSVALSASSLEPLSWYSSGGALLATGSVYITRNLSSTTQYYVVAGTTCPSQPSSVTAHVFPAPSIYLGADTVINSGSSLTLDAGPAFTDYLWSTGATTQSIVVNSADLYSVTVTDANNCTATDMIDIGIYTGLSNQHSATNSLKVYPTPARDHIVLQYQQTGTSAALIRLFNPEGKLMLMESHNGAVGVQEVSLDLSQFGSGIYFLSVIENFREQVILLPLN